MPKDYKFTCPTIPYPNAGPIEGRKLQHLKELSFIQSFLFLGVHTVIRERIRTPRDGKGNDE
jgi:hypothetical protein